MVTMADIHKLLESIAPPGEKRDEKRAAVERLFREDGARRTNSQGFDVLDDLSSYPEY